MELRNLNAVFENNKNVIDDYALKMLEYVGITDIKIQDVDASFIEELNSKGIEFWSKLSDNKTDYCLYRFGILKARFTIERLLQFNDNVWNETIQVGEIEYF